MTACRPIQVRGRPIGSGSPAAIITPLVGRTPAELESELQEIVPKQPDLLEWRVDFFGGVADADQVLATAAAIKRQAGSIPLLLTRRSAAEGGEPVAVTEAAVAALYCRACEARCIDLIDYELSNPPEHLARVREVSAANGIAMIMSYHNFRLTPDAGTLVGRFAEAQRLGADVAKVAVMPGNPLDVLTLLAATHAASQHTRIPLIGLSMGGVGSISRIAGWLYGSAATFAVGKHSSAPGQLAIEEVRAALATIQHAVTGG